MPPGLSVGVIGATGAVGQEIVRLLEDRRFPVESLRLFASERSAGKTACFAGRSVPIEHAETAALQRLDLCFFSAGAAVAKRLVPHALQEGAVAIDNSSAFRLEADVPLAVPEINPEVIVPAGGLYPVANCTAIILCMALAPLRPLGTMRRVIASTYQSASGAGAAAMRELLEQTRDVLDGKAPRPKVFPHPIAFNLFSHNTTIGDDGANGEERKVVQETRKILDMPQLRVGVTCVRVPVLRAHSIAATVEFDGSAPSLEGVREAYRAFPGLRLVDDRESNHFPMPSEASGREEVLVGRIRQDPSHPSAISLFVCGDQLLKGAALNAVQIAEALVTAGRFR